MEKKGKRDRNHHGGGNTQSWRGDRGIYQLKFGWSKEKVKFEVVLPI